MPKGSSDHSEGGNAVTWTNGVTIAGDLARAVVDNAGYSDATTETRTTSWLALVLMQGGRNRKTREEAPAYSNNHVADYP